MRVIHRDIAGAFIFSGDNKVLLGYSGVFKNQLVVPGGGIDAGESAIEAVIREVREETGLDITSQIIEQLPSVISDESDKTLRDSGEIVHVHMNFYDFTIKLDTLAIDTSLSMSDDFQHGQWYAAEELKNQQIGSAAASRLQQLGFIK